MAQRNWRHTSGWRSLAARLAIASLCATALTPLASAQTLGPLTRLSFGTPWTSCRADHVRQQDGTSFAPAPVEPWLAADPSHPGRLLAGSQQDRWSNGGARGLAAFRSLFYGRIWNRSTPQGVSQCSGGALPRASDAWTGFGGDGTAYFFSLAFSDTESAMLASRSTDGGLTWAAPVSVIDDTDPAIFNDKNSLTADALRPSYAYTVWDRLDGAADDDRGAPKIQTQPASLIDTAAIARHDGVARAQARIALLRAAARGDAAARARLATSNTSFGPTYFSRTTDSGRSWSKAVPIYDPGPNAQTIGNVVLAAKTGAIHDLFTAIDAAGNTSLKDIVSNDQGSTWSAPRLIAAYDPQTPLTPDARFPIRAGDIVPAFAISPADGTLYAVWSDIAPGGTAIATLLSQSRDGGSTWSAAIRVNQTPANANPRRASAFTPAVTVAADGTVVVSYTDFRRDTSSGELADIWASFCSPSGETGCASAAAWGRELRLTGASFDYLNAPNLRAPGHLFFLGDYMGLAAQGKRVWAVFAAAGSTANTSVLYSREIDLP